MSDKNDTSERRFKATRRRLRQARRDGDAPRSRELMSAASLGAAALAFSLGGGLAVQLVADLVSEALSAPQQSREVVLGQLVRAAALTTGLTAAFCGGVGLVATLGGLLQAPPVFSLKKVAFDLSRLNPARGVSGVFKVDALVSLGRTLAMAALLTLVLYRRILAALPGLLALGRTSPEGVAASLAAELGGMLRTAALVAIAIGAADFLYQRHAFEKRLRMTQEEFKRDRKEAEGDPRLKGRRRRLFREWMNHNAVQAAQAATVVVTNPTHIAVALHYDPVQNPAPIIAAKGAGELASQIRAAAQGAGVPIIENVPLARALHWQSEIDDVVPEALFAAVAEVIVWASQMRPARNHAATEEPSP